MSPGQFYRPVLVHFDPQSVGLRNLRSVEIVQVSVHFSSMLMLLI